MPHGGLRRVRSSLNSKASNTNGVAGLDLNSYKQQIAALYDRRSHSYDASEWHINICRRLLQHSQIISEQHVLDIGTGTGHLALLAAQAVGPQGKVVGIDIAAEMLAQARSKAKAANADNVSFILADAEALDFPANTFDQVLCANTFPWIGDKEAALSLWRSLLRPGGTLAIHTPADSAYVRQNVLREVVAAYGVCMEPSNRIGSLQQFGQMLEESGFKLICVETEQHGSYISLEKARGDWERFGSMPSTKCQDPLQLLSEKQQQQAKLDFESAMEARATSEGVWDDLSTWYVRAKRHD